MFDLPEEAQARVRHELFAGETLRWVEKAEPQLKEMQMRSMCVVAVFLVVFSIIWIAGATRLKLPRFTTPEDFFVLFGLPFLLLGVGILISLGLKCCWMKKTLYVITNYRALIIGRDVRSFYRNNLKKITRCGNRDGRGNVYFSTERYKGKHGSQLRRIGFMNIANSRDVELLLNRLEDMNCGTNPLSTPRLSPKKLTRVQQALQSGETLLWAAMAAPFTGILSLWPISAFGTVFLSCSLLGLYQTLHPICKAPTHSHISIVVVVWSSFFVLLGIGIFCLPVLQYFFLRKRIYAITNFRALVIDRTVDSYYRDDLAPITRKCRFRGRGDVIFAVDTETEEGVKVTFPVGFIGISNPREVESLLVRLETIQH